MLLFQIKSPPDVGYKSVVYKKACTIVFSLSKNEEITFAAWVYFCLSAISLGRYCRKSLAKKGGFGKKIKRGMAIYGGVYKRGEGFRPSAQFAIMRCMKVVTFNLKPSVSKYSSFSAIKKINSFWITQKKCKKRIDVEQHIQQRCIPRTCNATIPSTIFFQSLKSLWISISIKIFI